MSDTMTLEGVDVATPGGPDGGPDTGLVSRVMVTVTEHIRIGRLKSGDPLPSEASLSAEVGVSRAVVREGLRSLATLGVIEIGNGRRARVGGLDKHVFGLLLDHAVQTDQASILQIYDVRRTIELRTVVLAALRRSDADAAEITALAAAMRADFADPARVMAHDIAFHEVIARSSRNPLFHLLVASFHVVTRQTWPIGWASRREDDDRRASIATHQRIAGAIHARDPSLAETLMAEHFDSSVKALLAAGIT